MAKNKVKSKKDKKQKSFGEYIRMLMSVQGKLSSEMVLTEMNIELIEDSLNHFKEIYSKNIEIGNVSNYINYLTFTKMVDAVYDILYLYSLDENKDFNKIIKNVNLRLIEELKENETIGLELFVAINKLCFLFDREMLLTKNFNQNIIENLSGVIFSNSIYIQTYLTKFENKQIRTFEFKKGTNILDVKYTDVKLIDDNILINAKRGCLNGIFDNNVRLFLKSFMEDIHLNYESFLSGESTRKQRICYHLDESFEINPLYKECGLIGLNELRKIPNDRKYLYSSGVRFTFLKKTSNIERVDIIENEKEFLFYLKIKNENNIRKLNYDRNTSTESDLYHGRFNKYDYPIANEKHVIARFSIKKKSLNTKLSEETLVLLAETMSDCKVIGNTNVFYAINYMLLSCLYMALYNPFLFKNLITTTGIRREGNTFVKEDSFRVAHIRKLKRGAIASLQAKANAKEFGFNIPTGYTFVSAHYTKEDVLKKGNKKEIKLNL